MKKAIIIGLAVLMVVFTAMAQKKVKCTTIQQGILTYSPGHYLYGTPLPTGYDPYGYNYQSHMFNGTYANAYLGGYGFPPYPGDDAEYFALPFFVSNPAKIAAVKATWVWPYRKDNVAMKWNDAWLSNQDCDYNGKLDRPANYIGSGAWETNHQSGTYEVDGNVYFWNYFVKIVAVGTKDVLTNGVWYTKQGVEIGPAIWGSFAIIQEVYNDTGTGDHGISFRSPAGPGLGKDW